MKSSKRNQKRTDYKWNLKCFFSELSICYASANKALGCTSLYATSAGNVTKPQEEILSGSVAVICETSQCTCTGLQYWLHKSIHHFDTTGYKCWQCFVWDRTGSLKTAGFECGLTDHSILESSYRNVRFINSLTPNDPYRGRTAPLTSKCCILYVYSTNIGTKYFKHGIYSPVFLSVFKMQFVS